MTYKVLSGTLSLYSYTTAFSTELFTANCSFSIVVELVCLLDTNASCRGSYTVAVCRYTYTWLQVVRVILLAWLVAWLNG